MTEDRIETEYAEPAPADEYEIATAAEHAARLTAMSVEDLIANGSTEDVRQEIERIAKRVPLGEPHATAHLTSRARAHSRFESGLTAGEDAYRAAVAKVRQEAGDRRRHPEGVSVASLVAAHSLGQLVKGSDRAKFVEDVQAAIDLPALPGQVEHLSDEDHQAAWAAEKADLTAREQALRTELQARQAAAMAGFGGARIERVAQLMHGKPKKKP